MSSKVVSIGSKVTTKSAAELRSDRIKSNLIKELEEAIEKVKAVTDASDVFETAILCVATKHTHFYRELNAMNDDDDTVDVPKSIGLLECCKIMMHEDMVK